MATVAFCPSCGRPRVEGLGFCAGCGLDLRAVGQAPRSDSAPSYSVPSGDGGVSCPNGGHPNLVLSVNAVYSAGISATALSGPSAGLTFTGDGLANSIGYTSLAGVSQTGLSARLAPPPEPKYVSPWGWWTWICLGILSLLLFASSGASSQPGRADPSVNTQYGLAAIASLAAIVWIIWYQRKRQGLRHRELDRVHPLWQAAIERWRQAYYCSKCDRVFIPGLTGLMTTTQAQETIFSPG